MKKFFNWVIVLAAIAGAFYCIGLIVPRTLTSGSKTTFEAGPEKMQALVADVANWPRWQPDVLGVQEQPERNKHPVWRISEKSGMRYDLEVVAVDDRSWQASYAIDDQHYTLRYDFGWFGSGGRVHLVRTISTPDTWKRAKSFLWSRSETSPVGLLNALSKEIGENTKVTED